MLQDRFLQIKYIGTIKVSIGTYNWDVETYRKKLEKTILKWKEVKSRNFYFLEKKQWLWGFLGHRYMRPQNSNFGKHDLYKKCRTKTQKWHLTSLCHATLYPFGGTGRIQYVRKGEGSMKLLTYLILPELKTYSLNHRRSLTFEF